MEQAPACGVDPAKLCQGEYAIRVKSHIAVLAAPLLTGCGGRHSWLAGAGAEARIIETLFWPFLFGAAVLWLAVMALAIAAFRSRREETRGLVRAIIIGGGAIVPGIIVAALLVIGLVTLRALAAMQPGLSVQVDGEQWWWRVVYDTPAGAVVTANEIRLPRGETAELLLSSDDVIHAFWAPALGGKMDMIPGRTNRLTLTPLTPGSWGGLCAEYCGGAHAQMRFDVTVMEPAAFGDWLAAEAEPASAQALARQDGLSVFLDSGCGACHSVRGTEAAGQVGPDLTHFAARQRLGAGIAPLTDAALRRWITRTQDMKPGVEMPAYPDLSPEALDALVGFLMALK
ncbi:cytochrome c oxidase subunit II [Lutimaribacter pacificus]|uniref:cytochrome c oxidase subunit II n=1 Tax=Lutimaribacter pacificus TaxID=391948 RepID=UPI001CB801A2|nr:c-type cytochrome [Lutimaribacter pacificus]